MFRPMVSWQRMQTPLITDKYSVIIGTPIGLMDVLTANLQCIARQDLDRLQEIIVVIDSLKNVGLSQSLQSQFASLPLSVRFMSRAQMCGVRLASIIAKPAWIKCWLSWTIGISHATTRTVILHDLDALPIKRTFFRDRFIRFLDSNSNFLGARYYSGNGVVPDDCLAVTFELVFNAECVRMNAHPTDLYNQVSLLRDRRVEFDTFLWVQRHIGGVKVNAWPDDDLVHPSQMICQHVEFVENGKLLSTDRHNLLLIPFYASVGGDDSLLERLCSEIESVEFDGTIDYQGRRLSISSLAIQHREWICNLAEKIDKGVFSQIRPSTQRFVRLIR